MPLNIRLTVVSTNIIVAIYLIKILKNTSTFKYTHFLHNGQKAVNFALRREKFSHSASAPPARRVGNAQPSSQWRTPPPLHRHLHHIPPAPLSWMKKFPSAHQIHNLFLTMPENFTGSAKNRPHNLIQKL